MDGQTSRRKCLKETLFSVIALAAAKIILLDIARAEVASEIQKQFHQLLTVEDAKCPRRSRRNTKS
jgi:hypothetical protein